MAQKDTDKSKIIETSKWYSVTDAMEYLSVSRPTIYSYMKNGKLPFYYIAGTRNRRLRKEDLINLFTLGDPNELDEDS